MSITNVYELRDFMSEELHRLRSGNSTPSMTNASANLCGKIMQSVKMELEYNKMVGATPNISFLKKTDQEIKVLEKKS